MRVTCWFRLTAGLVGALLCASPAPLSARGCPQGTLPLSELVGALPVVPAEGLELQRLLAGMEHLTLAPGQARVQGDAAGFVGGSLARLTEPTVIGEPSSGLYAESSSLFGGMGARAAGAFSLGSTLSLGGMVGANVLLFRDDVLGAALSTALPFCAAAGPISIVVPRITLDVHRSPLEEQGTAVALRLLPGAEVGVFQPAGSAWVALRGTLSSSLSSMFQMATQEPDDDTIAASVEVLAYHRALVPQLPALLSTRAAVQATLQPEAMAPSTDTPEPAVATTGWAWTSRTQLALAPRVDRAVQLGGALELELGWFPDLSHSTGGGGRIWVALTPHPQLQLLLAVRARAVEVVSVQKSSVQYSGFDWSATAVYAF